MGGHIGVSLGQTSKQIRSAPGTVFLRDFGIWLQNRPYPLLGYDPARPESALLPRRGPPTLQREEDEEVAVAFIVDLMTERGLPMKAEEIIHEMKIRGVFPKLQDPFSSLRSLLHRNRRMFVSLRVGRYWPYDLDNELYGYDASTRARGGRVELTTDLVRFDRALAAVLPELTEPVSTARLCTALALQGYPRRDVKTLRRRAQSSGQIQELEDGRWCRPNVHLARSA